MVPVTLAAATHPLRGRWRYSGCEYDGASLTDTWARVLYRGNQNNKSAIRRRVSHRRLTCAFRELVQLKIVAAVNTK